MIEYKRLRCRRETLDVSKTSLRCSRRTRATCLTFTETWTLSVINIGDNRLSNRVGKHLRRSIYVPWRHFSISQEFGTRIPQASTKISKSLVIVYDKPKEACVSKLVRPFSRFGIHRGITSRLRSSQILLKVYTRSKRYCSFYTVWS